MKRVWLIILGLVLILPGVPARAGEYRLYKDYTIGIPRTLITALPGIYDGAKIGAEGTLAQDFHRFLEEDWTILYTFASDKLVQISLRTKFGNDLYSTVLKTLSQKFTLMSLECAEESLDLVHLAELGVDPLTRREKAAELEKKGLDRWNLKYVFYEQEAIKAIQEKAKNVAEVRDRAPDGLREVDFLITKEKDGSQIFLLTFQVPKVAAKMIKEAGEAKKEDF